MRAAADWQSLLVTDTDGLLSLRRFDEILRSHSAANPGWRRTQDPRHIHWSSCRDDYLPLQSETREVQLGEVSGCQGDEVVLAGGQKKRQKSKTNGTIRGWESYCCFGSRSAMFRRGDVSENKLRPCLIPGRLVKALVQSNIPRAGYDARSDAFPTTDVKMKARSSIRRLGEALRRVQRRACGIEPYFRHVKASDMAKRGVCVCVWPRRLAKTRSSS